MTVVTLFWLYVGFRLKQYICDFLLQSRWMAIDKGMQGRRGYVPLAVHAGIHGGGTLLLALLFAPALWWLAPLDFVVHGFIDRVTARLKDVKNLTPVDTSFWWLTGLDQEAHNFTHLTYISFLFFHMGGIHA